MRQAVVRRVRLRPSLVSNDSVRVSDLEVLKSSHSSIQSANSLRKIGLLSPDGDSKPIDGINSLSSFNWKLSTECETNSKSLQNLPFLGNKS